MNTVPPIPPSTATTTTGDNQQNLMPTPAKSAISAGNKETKSTVRFVNDDKPFGALGNFVESYHKKQEDRRFTYVRNKKGEKEFIRNKLPSIEAYQQVVKIQAEGTNSLILRLDKLMGTSYISPSDINYMTPLREKLDAEDGKWKQRIAARMNTESERCRQLVINGFLEPTPGMEDVTKHPVYRVKRAFDRLKKIADTSKPGAFGDFYVEPPPIKPCDPFEDFENTGYLFGQHPRHYLKIAKQKSAEKQKAAEEEQKDEEPLEIEDIYQRPMLNSEGHMIMVPMRITSQQSFVLKPQSSKSSRISTPPVSPMRKSTARFANRYSIHVPSIKALIEKDKSQNTSTISLPVVNEIIPPDETPSKQFDKLKKKYGIVEESIDAMWDKHESSLIKRINTEMGSNNLFDESNKALNTFKREDIRTQNFVSTKLRKLLQTTTYK